MKQIVCTAILFACCVWGFLLAGASDCETLSFSSIVAQGTSATVIGLISSKIGGII